MREHGTPEKEDLGGVLRAAAAAQAAGVDPEDLPATLRPTFYVWRDGELIEGWLLDDLEAV